MQLPLREMAKQGFSYARINMDNCARRSGAKVKKLVILLACFSLVISKGFANPLQDLLDGKRQGLFLSGQIGLQLENARIAKGTSNAFVYLTRENYSDADIFADTFIGYSVLLDYKIGYAISERWSVYLSPPALSIGVLMFQNTGYYYSGNFQYYQDIADEFWLIGVGFGKEFRKHYTIEVMARAGQYAYGNSAYQTTDVFLLSASFSCYAY